MNYIKTESEVAICHGCLSTDRRLSPLKNYELYFILLEEKQRTEVLKKAYIMVCWECTAILNRFQSFRARVQRAHTILHETLSTPTNASLSQLVTNIKDTYDAYYQESILLEDHFAFKTAPTDIIKYESDVEDMPIDEDEIKVEKSKSNAPSKKREAKKTAETRKIKNFLEVNAVTDLKVDKSIKNKSNTKKSKRQEKDVCNINDEQTNVIKVEIKLEKNSDTEEKLPNPAFDKPNITNENSDSEYCLNEDDEETPKASRKRSFTYEKVEVNYSHNDVLSHFTKVKMSEVEMKSILEKQAETENKAKPNKCEFCGFRFVQRKSLGRHINLCHKQDMRIKKTPNDPDKIFLYQCNYCSTMVKNDHAFAHLREFHKHKFYCRGCSWSEAFFWKKEDHSNHWQKVHAVLQCDLCPQTRRSVRHMEQHIRSKHLPWKCSKCKKTFAKVKAFRRHEKLAHSGLEVELPESRYCVECDRQFQSVSSYKLHVSNRHRIKKPRKRWPCPVCGKQLSSRGTMKEHFDFFHSDGTRFPCPQCGKYLSSKTSLQNHIKSHLNIRKPKNKLCSICGRGFSTRRMLRFHTYTHTGERPYACAHCPAAFAQPTPLLAHARKQHPHLPAAALVHPPV